MRCCVNFGRRKGLQVSFPAVTQKGFLSAEAFSVTLGNAIDQLEAGNEAVLVDLSLWFLPSSDWDDLIKTD
jgi:hypothetical protein